jgi:hypothetical protein
VTPKKQKKNNTWTHFITKPSQDWGCGPTVRAQALGSISSTIKLKKKRSKKKTQTVLHTIP